MIRDYAIPLVQQLKNAGYGVYYLSNYSKKAYDECGESLAFMPYMDGGLVSFRVGMTKPDPQVFKCFLDSFHLEPESCLFIDDTEENVRAAEALGYLTPDSNGGYWSKYVGNCEIYTAKVSADGKWSVPVSLQNLE
ncbi:MAG: HAD-IA family hydrolase [Eubacterium sp.]|nr:HAD-IA family hydrolase [Eubacterium sp.]